MAHDFGIFLRMECKIAALKAELWLGRVSRGRNGGLHRAKRNSAGTGLQSAEILRRLFHPGRLRVIKGYQGRSPWRVRETLVNLRIRLRPYFYLL